MSRSFMPSQKTPPQIALLLCLRYSLEGRYGDIAIFLKVLAETLNCKKALEELKQVNDIVYYSGNSLSYYANNNLFLNVFSGNTSNLLEKGDILRIIVKSKEHLHRAMLALIEEVEIDLPSFVEAIKSGSA